MIGGEKYLGKPISDELSKYIMVYTTTTERLDSAKKFNVSHSTIRDVANGTNSLTKNNVDALLDLMKKAVKNCTEEMQRATNAKDYLLRALDIEDWS